MGVLRVGAIIRAKKLLSTASAGAAAAECVGVAAAAAAWGAEPAVGWAVVLRARARARCVRALAAAGRRSRDCMV